MNKKATKKEVPLITMWDKRDEFIKIFPEISNLFDASLAAIKHSNCSSCSANQKKAQVIGEMVRLSVLKGNIEIPKDLLVLLDPLYSAAIAKRVAPVQKADEFAPRKKVIRKQPPPEKKGPVTKTIRKPLNRTFKAPREPCVECVRKHVAQAVILLGESLMGYPEHRWLAVGHLAEASEECLGIYPLVAADLRDKRLALMAGESPDLMVYLRDDFEILNNELSTQS